MQQSYTAVIQQQDGWWIGWIQEILGVNCQERTRDELLDTLEVTLRETIEYNREEARSAAVGNQYQEVTIHI
jgi:predicted RNase H-like HicB family nuclease